jgi:D-3-phosphoglycerate dehydrogenase
MNIAEMANKSRGDVAYSMFDLDTPVTDELVKKLEAVDGVFRVRVIK